MAKKIDVFASEAQQGELENFPDIKRGWGVTKSKTGGIPPMRWYNAIQNRTDEAINQVSKESINGYTFKDGGVADSQNDWFEHQGNFYYRKSGFPYTVEAGKTPEADGGVWSESNPDGLWVDVGQNSLRSDIGIVIKTYNTVNDMKADATLQMGVFVETLGYHSILDGGGARYHIESGSGADGMADHKLINGLIAKLSTYSIRTLGVYASEDATNAINLMLNRGKPVYIDENYTVNVDETSSAINIKDGSYIRFEGGSLRLKPTSKERYEVISCVGANDFKIISPVLIGDKNEHLGTTGEWGHGIYITASQNGLVENPVITNMWGDGLCISSPTEVDLIESPSATKNITVVNGEFKNCRRQGFSITGGRNIFFIGQQLCENIKGASPEGAFDIEVNNFVPLKNLTIQSVIGRNCNGYTFNIFSNNGTRVMEDITIGNLVSINGRRGALSLSRTESSVKGLMKNIYIESIHQVVNNAHNEDLAAYYGFYFSLVDDIKIGALTSDFDLNVANSVRCLNSSEVYIRNMSSGGAKVAQVSYDSTLIVENWTVQTSTANAEQLYVSSGGHCIIGELNVPVGKINALVTGDGSLLSINGGTCTSKASARDLFFRCTQLGTLNISKIYLDVINKGRIIDNESGVVRGSHIDFGFNKLNSVGVHTMGAGATYLDNCTMLSDAPKNNNSMCIYEDGSKGFVVNCATTDANNIRILGSGDSVRTKGNTSIY